MSSQNKKNIESLIIPPKGVSFNENTVFRMIMAQPENDTFNYRMIFRWSTETRPFDEVLFSNIINFLVNRHDVFSYTYEQDLATGGPIKKIVQKPLKIDIPIHRLASQEMDPVFLKYCKELGKGLFPLIKAPLLKVNIVYDKDNKAFTVFYYPHIIMDGFCLGRVIYSEFTYLYKEFLNKNREEQNFENFRAILEDPKPYSDYVKVEREIFEKKIDSVKAFYAERFKIVDLSNKLLTLDGEEKMIKGSFRVFQKSKCFLDLLKENSLTASQLFLTIYQIALYQVLGLKGIPISKMYKNRKEEYQGTVGWFAHEMVVIEEVREEYTIEDLYQKNHDTARYMLSNFGDVDGIVASRLLGMPAPRFKFNYIPGELDVITQDVIFLMEPDFYEGFNWEGELFKVKFGYLAWEKDNFFSFTFYHQKNDFPDEIAKKIIDTNQGLAENVQNFWKTPINNIPKYFPSINDSKL